jgi:myo-inositol-1(or 4)-monophosphatase
MTRDEMQDQIEPRAALMARATEEAGALARDFWHRRAELAIEEKADPRDIVSLADREVETALRRSISAAFPEDGFLGEELGLQGGASPFTWVIDPIDGTQPFLTGNRSWCVSVALVEHETVVAGAVAVPLDGELFTARRGAGVRVNGTRLRIDPAARLSSGMTGLGANHRTDPAAIAGTIERLMRAGGIFYRDGSGAIMLTKVAAGRLVGYFEPHIHAWDCYAGLLMIEEAGGRVGPWPDLLTGGRIIAAAPGAWDDLVAVAEGA